MARRVLAICRTIPAIGKHIVAQYSLAGGDEGIGVEETAEFRIIITALQIIERCFVIENIASVAERVDLTKGIRKASGDAEDPAASIVGVYSARGFILAHELNHIILQGSRNHRR